MNCPNCKKYAPDNNYKCPYCGKILQPERDPLDFRKMQPKRSAFRPVILVYIVIVIGLAVLIYSMFIKSSGKDIKTDTPVVSQKVKKPKSATPSSQFSEMFKDIGETQSSEDASTGTDTDTDTDPDEDTDAGGDAGDDFEIDGEDIKVGYVVNLKNPGEQFYIEDFIQGGKTTVFDFYSDYCPPCRQFSPWLQELDRRRDDIVVFKVNVNRPTVTGIDWRSPLTNQYNIKRLPYFVIYNTTGTRTHEGRPATEQVVKYLRSEGIIK